MKSPRVVLLTTYYYPVLGGVESHARWLAVSLHQAKMQVIVLTKRLDRGSPRLEVIDDVPVHRIPPLGTRISHQKWLMIPFAIIALLRLRKQFDLIYCPGYRGIGLAALVVGKLLQRPVILCASITGVVSCRNWDATLSRWHINPAGWLARSLKWPVQKAYASASAFVCISREIEAETRQVGIPPARIHYVPHGVDTERFRPPRWEEKIQIKRQEGWPEQRLICMYVGRLSVEKGILDLLAAWQLLTHHPAMLVVVGPDMPGHHMDVGAAVRELAAAPDMAQRVILYGPDDNVARLLRGADIFVQPSHYEAFAVSVLEAMATGLPVVASRVGGMLDYLVDGVNALLCTPASPADLAAQLCHLLDDPTLRHRLGKAARATVEKEFNESLIFKKLANLFSKQAPASSV